MDKHNLLDFMNNIYNVCDILDNVGGGVLTLTNGDRTTKDALRLEIFQFLVYIGAGACTINDAQTSLAGTVLGVESGELTSEQFRTVANELGFPNANNNLTARVFLNGDQSMSQQNTSMKTSFTDVLFSAYRVLGKWMLELNENPVSQQRYDDYMRDLRNLIADGLRQTKELYASSYSDNETDAIMNGNQLSAANMEKAKTERKPCGGKGARVSGENAHLKKTIIVDSEGGVGFTEKYLDVDPADELYQHYGKLKKEHEKFSDMGVIHVQNSGEEFQAIPLMDLLRKNGHSQNGIYEALMDAETNDAYILDQTALRLAQVFRVNKESFVSRHDAEGEIHERLMDKKWKLSALRSFAWTLADMADREKRSIDDYNYEALADLCHYIKARKWLNYEGGSWFDGLCGQPDIHVFYMPDSVIKSGKAEEIHKIMCYAPIFSLDALRDNLALLENVMKRLYNGLLENRDRSEYLDVPTADVLYAWCVMAVSARSAFFSEDGPTMFFHSYPSGVLDVSKVSLNSAKVQLKKAAVKSMKRETSSELAKVKMYEIIKCKDGKERLKFGEYPKGEPITWLVMEKKDGVLLLLSEFGLDAKPFFERFYGEDHDLKSTNQWEGSTLRRWLNHEFCEAAFTAKERSMIQLTKLDNYNIVNNEEEPCASTEDRVYLLSRKEMKTLFPEEQNRICKATAYARQQGAEIEAGPNQCHWWLRCPGICAMGIDLYVARVSADSSLKAWGQYSREVCIRPVIRVKAEALMAVENSGAAKRKAKSSSTFRVSGTQKATAAPEKNRKSSVSTLQVKPKQGFTQYLSYDEVVFQGKLFAFAGMSVSFGSSLEERIKKAGGELRQDVTSKTDYLVIRDLDVKEGVKLKKAMGYIDGGQNLKIILLENFEKSIGAACSFETTVTAQMEQEEAERKKEEERHKFECDMNREITLDLRGATIIKNSQFAYANEEIRGRIIIPEGVTDIGNDAFKRAEISEVVFPKTLKKIDSCAFWHCEYLEKIELQDGVEEIGYRAFSECPKLMDVHLPDSLRDVNEYAFGGTSNSRVDVTLHMSGKLAQYFHEHSAYYSGSIIRARGFIIDGKRYDGIKEYVKKTREQAQLQREAEERERQARARREREAAERQAIEARKATERERINEEIHDISEKMDSLHGLFAGIRRKKLQQRIDELNEQLRRLQI